jgi:hypothetical protein
MCVSLPRGLRRRRAFVLVLAYVFQPRKETTHRPSLIELINFPGVTLHSACGNSLHLLDEDLANYNEKGLMNN